MRSSLRIVTWNCRSGPLGQRLSELAEYAPDLVFLQECTPTAGRVTSGVVCSRRVNSRKGVALIAAPHACRCRPVRLLRSSGRASVAVTVTAPTPFTAIGVWAQQRDYVGDVVRTIRAHRTLIRDAPAVVMGDFNSGTSLARPPSQNPSHRRLLDEFRGLDLVSAYHAFHGIGHGDEAEATYFHQWNPDRPWHIDFCFIPQAWASRLVNVAVIDGASWARRSDHRPLLVEVRLVRSRASRTAPRTDNQEPGTEHRERQNREP